MAPCESKTSDDDEREAAEGEVRGPPAGRARDDDRRIHRERQERDALERVERAVLGAHPLEPGRDAEREQRCRDGDRAPREPLE